MNKIPMKRVLLSAACILVGLTGTALSQKPSGDYVSWWCGKTAVSLQ
jgi:hypothetical protein